MESESTVSEQQESIWFVRLTDRYPTPLVLIAAFVLMSCPWWPWYFELIDLPMEAWTDTEWLRFGSSLFFPTEATYGVWLGSYLVRKTIKDVDGMQPFLDYGPQQHEDVRYSLSHVPARSMLIASVLGAITGFILQYLAGAGPARWMFEGRELVAIDYWWMVSPMILWTLVFQLGLIFDRGASTISRVVNDHLEVDLLHVKTLSVFAAGVIRNTLVFVFGTIPFPLLMLDGNIDLMRIIPGYTLIIGILLWMLITPIRAVHDRISDIKDAELERIRLAMLGDRNALAESRLAEDAENVRMPELIAYKQVIDAVPEWPIDLPVTLKVMMYTLIPPLAWTGAALIEQAIANVV